MKRRRRISLMICFGLLLLLVAGCSTPDVAPSVTVIITPVQRTPTPDADAEPIETEEPAPPEPTMHLIYDDDGSRDGTAALLYLLSLPEVSVDAINISYGEAHPEIYIQQIGRMLNGFGISGIPLGAGQDAPLAGSNAFPDWLRDLSDNFWYMPLPNPDEPIPFEYSPELMVSTISQSPEPVTLYIAGPFTNLAQALQIDPGIRENIAAVYFMGGAVYAPGNITNLVPESSNGVAEWNIYSDPLAAEEVFEAGLEMYMIPLDATNQVIHVQDETAPWRQGDALANFVVDLYDIMFDEYGFEQVEIFDLTAAVIMVHPDLCEFEALHLDVVTEAGNTEGQTIVVPDSEPNMQVCTAPNVEQIKRNLDNVFAP